MAMWQAGLGYAWSVAQLAGVDPVSLITYIKQMARTASQNRADCDDLSRRVGMLADLLSRLRGGPSEPVAAPTVDGLGDALVEAFQLVQSCQAHGWTHQFFTASRKAERFRNVERKIDSYLQHFQAINNIAIDGLARRVDELVMHINGGGSALRDTTMALQVLYMSIYIFNLSGFCTVLISSDFDPCGLSVL